MGFLSKINKKLGFSKGTKERVRALKRREALGLNPKYVEDPYGPILNRPSRVPFDGQINEAALQARAPRMPRMPRIDDGRMRAMPIGPGARLQMPNFGSEMEQMPIARRDPSALERLPMGNMPDFSQIDMSQLDLSGIPQSISQMDLPQMPEGLPSMEEIQGNRRMPRNGYEARMQPRMMMAEGDEVMMMQENEMMAPNGGEIESHARRNGLLANKKQWAS
jgi:hypothetical protein